MKKKTTIVHEEEKKTKKRKVGENRKDQVPEPKLVSPKKAVKSGSGGKPPQREIVDEREDPQASDPSPQSAPKPKRAPPTNRLVKKYVIPTGPRTKKRIILEKSGVKFGDRREQMKPGPKAMTAAERRKRIEDRAKMKSKAGRRKNTKVQRMRQKRR